MHGVSLPAPDAYDGLPLEAVPAAIAALGAVQIRLAARLLHPPAAPRGIASGPEWVDVATAARLLGRSRSWVEKRGRHLPGFRQPGGPGTRCEWYRPQLVAWRDDEAGR
jgi:hypothetical protein